jgi:hypothetical protein
LIPEPNTKEFNELVKEKAKQLKIDLEEQWIRESRLFNPNIRRDMDKVQEYLDKGITLDQIIDLDLAIEVKMDLPQHKFRIV